MQVIGSDKQSGAVHVKVFWLTSIILSIVLTLLINLVIWILAALGR
jgi:hypothetical protein